MNGTREWTKNRVTDGLRKLTKSISATSSISELSVNAIEELHHPGAAEVTHRRQASSSCGAAMVCTETNPAAARFEPHVQPAAAAHRARTGTGTCTAPAPQLQPLPTEVVRTRRSDAVSCRESSYQSTSIGLAVIVDEAPAALRWMQQYTAANSLPATTLRQARISPSQSACNAATPALEAISDRPYSCCRIMLARSSVQGTRRIMATQALKELVNRIEAVGFARWHTTQFAHPFHADATLRTTSSRGQGCLPF